MGPSLFVRFNREGLLSIVTIWDQKIKQILLILGVKSLQPWSF